VTEDRTVASPDEARETRGWVYINKTDRPGLVKVGFSLKDPKLQAARFSASTLRLHMSSPSTQWLGLPKVRAKGSRLT
jgi:hypothetical protein